MDLAEGHVSALQYMSPDSEVTRSGFQKYSVFNLGTGIGYSVLDMVEAMKKTSGRPIPYEIGPPRDGDIAVCYADPSKAREQLGWQAKRNLDDMCTGVEDNNNNIIIIIIIIIIGIISLINALLLIKVIFITIICLPNFNLFY